MKFFKNNEHHLFLKDDIPKDRKMLPSKRVLDFSFHKIILGKIPFFYFYVPKMKDTFLSLRLSWLKLILN